ncbi:gamma-glutamylcyclotransferase [Halorussus gelatinilyticus]|uniref:Gamma-glutamylcyclotransferase n=1 Tax=Halorussus gelatinilyticus TaxID=2937524 RepID=A0A8U0IPB7_9EURY|nr:gamma-glutamylcyclotransferase family protein [Halorussus gelatinilyticus]UPW01849.1 gamma-glutamylcyclotransferase [Halorussus gelatinilyticus]
MEVFVYGTLTDPERVARVLPTFEFRGAATLDGLHRVEGEYPTLAPGGRTDGRLLETPEIEALDAYEGVERGLYVRVSVPVASGNHGEDRDRDRKGDAELYVGDPATLGADAEWPGTGSFAERVRRFCRESEVAVRLRGRD